MKSLTYSRQGMVPGAVEVTIFSSRGTYAIIGAKIPAQMTWVGNITVDYKAEKCV